MRRVLGSFLVAGSLFVFACGGGDSDTAKVKEFKGIVKEMCACTDKACADAVDKKEGDWRMANYKGLSKEERGAMKNARQEFTTCRDKHK